jgi:hypothetical protein
MRSFLNFVATFVRITLGALLVLVAMALLTGLAQRGISSGPPAYVAGQLISVLVLPLIFGIVGYKMMTRHRRKPSQVEV